LLKCEVIKRCLVCFGLVTSVLSFAAPGSFDIQRERDELIKPFGPGGVVGNGSVGKPGSAIAASAKAAEEAFALTLDAAGDGGSHDRTHSIVMTILPRQKPFEATTPPVNEECLGGEAWRRRAVPKEVSQEDTKIRELKSWQDFRDCPDCPEMLVLPAGRFVMGSRGLGADEEPAHRVSLPSFAVGKYEVTVAEFERFAKDTRHQPPDTCRAWAEGNGKWELEGKIEWSEPGYPQTARHPVTCISWIEAVDYAKWLSSVTGKRYRLLSEAEWEYAARGSRDETDRDQTYWGAEENQACRHGNFADTTTLGEFSWPQRMNCADGAWFASQVGQYRPNRFGLYDMLGNVWEWTEDCSTPNYSEGSPDGRPHTCGQCDRRVIRGGSWASKPADIRFGNRARASIDHRSVTIGFRIARDLE
jgi:formylglycine-generating enzyme